MKTPHGFRWMLLVGALAALFLVPHSAHAQEVDLTNTVTVAAGGSVELPADLAALSFGVRKNAATAQEATRQLGETTQAVVDAVRAAGVGQDDELSVGSVRLNRREDRFGNFIEYIASASVRVKTDNLGILGEIIDAGVSAGANSLGGLRYEAKDRTAAVERALVEAMNFAKAKATALATAAGRTVGMALIISEFDSRPPRSVPVMGRTAAGGAADAAASLIPTEPPILEATARISVTFGLI